jgi:hypothetical protein
MFTVDKEIPFKLTLLINLYVLLGIKPARSKMYKKNELQNMYPCVNVLIFVIESYRITKYLLLFVLYCHVSSLKVLLQGSPMIQQTPFRSPKLCTSSRYLFFVLLCFFSLPSTIISIFHFLFYYFHVVILPWITISPIS